MLLTLKRFFDLVIGTFLALMALPVVMMLAIWSAYSLRAWPVFVQERVGRSGKPFRFLKLRTLPTDTSPDIDKYHLTDIDISRFGRFLRRTHLDELPQLLLVPLGTMSLVGPRPEMPQLLGRYSERLVEARTRVRPGCTGLWQISPSSAKLIYESPEYDLAYLRYGGLRLDAWILYRTLRNWLPRSRPPELDDIPGWLMGRGFVPEREMQVRQSLRALSGGLAGAQFELGDERHASAGKQSRSTPVLLGDADVTKPRT